MPLARGGRNSKATLSSPNKEVEPGNAVVIDEIKLLRQDFQEIKSQLSNVTATLAEKVREYEFKLKVKNEEIIELKASVRELQGIMSSQEQYQLRNEMEILGFPESPNENLTHMLLVTSKKLGVDIQESDIDQIIRVGPRNKQSADSADKTRPIVAKLTRKAKRDELLSAAAKRRGLTSNDIVNGTSSILYFNERLSKSNRKLFGEARKNAKQYNFRYCWVRNGQILVRKAANSNDKKYPVHTIRTHDDIEKLFRPTAESDTNTTIDNTN